MYMLKENNGITRKRCEICSKLKIETPEIMVKVSSLGSPKVTLVILIFIFCVEVIKFKKRNKKRKRNAKGKRKAKINRSKNGKKNTKRGPLKRGSHLRVRNS